MASVWREPSALKVLWMTPNIRSAAGGPTSTVINGLIAESEGGTMPELATTGSPDRAEEASALAKLEVAGIEVHLFQRKEPTSSTSAWGLSPGLTLWLIRNLRRYDVLHLQYVWCWTTILGCVLGRLYRVPVVLTPHESLTSYDIEVASRSWSKRLMKRVLRRFVLSSVTQLLLMSWIEERDTKTEGVPAHRVPHAVPLPQSSSRVDPGRQGPGVKIGFIGRQTPKKGIDRLIQAVALSGHSGWELELAGPPPVPALESEYRGLIGELGLEARVRWLGFVDDRDAFLARLDLLVMPSEYEGFGMVAAEAMASGTPVIVPRESGIAQLVEESGGGIVVDRADPEQLREALVALAADPERRKRAGASAREAIERTHSPAAFRARTAQVYEEALGPRNAS